MQDLDRRGLATLASGHAAADLCQGSIPALIPFLVHQRGYSFGAAGVLLLVVTIGSSIIQPVFGALSDRLQLAWLMPVGVALAAVGIAGAGLFDSFALTCIVVGLGGLGVAAFHPEGARYANYASGRPPRHRHEPVQRRRQRRLRARARADHARRAPGRAAAGR